MLVVVLLFLFIGNFIFAIDDRYHTYDEIYQQLIEWNNEFGNNPNTIPQYPESGIIFQLIEIGYSNQYNLPFWAVKLSYNANVNEDEPRVLILGQCHAEEILGVEISMEIIDWFLHPIEHISIFSTILRPILQNTEVWIVPTHNPEGLSIVHGTEINGNNFQDITYRKNMTDINLDNIFSFQDGVGNDSDGVDLNRNYEFNWIFGDSKFMLDPGYGDYFAHFDYYRGPEPFSEAETQAIRDLALEYNFTLSIAYHSSRSGRVSEMVIYSWDWEDMKKSPDFPVIDEFGQEIAALIPKEVEEGYYFCTPGKSRKGNAHDWFYTQTGCIQYLIEVGTENMQPDEVLIEETIDRNMNAAFHLMNRAFYNPYGTANAYQVTGIVTNSITGEPIIAEIEIEEMSGGMLKPRLTDEFGRYRRLLTNGIYNMDVSSRGYEKQEFEIIPSSGSVTTRNIELMPLNSYNVNFNINFENNIEQEVLVILKDEFINDSLIFNNNNFTIELPQNQYNIQILSEGLFPEIIDINLESDTTIAINMDVYTELYLETFDDLLNWEIETGEWTTDLLGNLISQDNLLYPSSSNWFISSNEEIANSILSEIVIEIDWKYEMEWDNDSAYFSMISNNDTINTYWTDQKWELHKIIIKNPYLNGNPFYIGIGLKSDETVGFRGIQIDQISIKAKGEIELDNEYLYIPEESTFFLPYPNPFNPLIELSFFIGESQNLLISIIDINGKTIETIFSGMINSGNHELRWDSGDLSSGIYFIKYELEDVFEFKKITLLK